MHLATLMEGVKCEKVHVSQHEPAEIRILKSLNFVLFVSSTIDINNEVIDNKNI